VLAHRPGGAGTSGERLGNHRRSSPAAHGRSPTFTGWEPRKRPRRCRQGRFRGSRSQPDDLILGNQRGTCWAHFQSVVSAVPTARSHSGITCAIGPSRRPAGPRSSTACTLLRAQWHPHLARQSALNTALALTAGQQPPHLLASIGLAHAPPHPCTGSAAKVGVRRRLRRPRHVATSHPHCQRPDCWQSSSLAGTFRE